MTILIIGDMKGKQTHNGVDTDSGTFLRRCFLFLIFRKNPDTKRNILYFCSLLIFDCI